MEEEGDLIDFQEKHKLALWQGFCVTEFLEEEQDSDMEEVFFKYPGLEVEFNNFCQEEFYNSKE